MLTDNVNLNGKTILVTGAAGFIGANLCKRLLNDYADCKVVGIDNLTDYYDVRLKQERLDELSAYGERFVFLRQSIADKEAVDGAFAAYRPQVVVNLAAQAGVRYSIINPDAYIESNLIGFYNILEACRHSYDSGRTPVEHLVYASSSSVYGSNKKVPYSTDDKVDNPVSLYAATKKSNELLAHAYSKLYNIPSTGLRFFTVYGPCGRPDMAYFGFTDKLVKGETIKIFNYGNCKRDFTYIDDIVEGVVRVMRHAPKKASPQPTASTQPSPKGKGAMGVHTADPMVYGLLKQYAEENRKKPTEAEMVLWDALKANGLGVKFRQQHIIEDFIVDFYCNEAQLTIEVDGSYHNRPKQMKSDEERTARLAELGFTELRFKNEEVLYNLDNVLKTIRTFCHKSQACKSSPSGEDLGEAPPYAVYNIGNNAPENLLDFVQILQEELVRAGVLPADYDFEAHKELVPMQPGDVPVTYADTTPLERDFGFRPSTPLRTGLRRFADWYANRMS